MLADISVQIARVILTLFIIFGTLGNALNLCIFTRPNLYRSPCTLYLIAASIDNLIVTYTTMLTRLLADGYSIDPTAQSMIFCKVRYYVGYVFFALSPYFFILACFDRYCSSSQSVALRSWSDRRVAKRLIVGAIIVACLVYLHMAIFFEVQTIYVIYTYCYSRQGFYSTFYSIFYIIAYCMLPPFLMGLFTILTLGNVRRQSRQIMPSTATHGVHRRLDRQLMRMLFSQVLTQLVCVLPFATLNLIAVFMSATTVLTFLNQLARIPLFFSYAASFYVFTLSSPVYKRELMKFIKYRRLGRQDPGEFTLGTFTLAKNGLNRPTQTQH